MMKEVIHYNEAFWLKLKNLYSYGKEITMKMLNKLITAVAIAATTLGSAGCGSVAADADTSSGGDIIAETTPVKGSYTIVDTDQTSCYGDSGYDVACPFASESFFGQDAQYSGLTPNYTVGSDGTVTDENTGLMWQQDPGDKVTYDEASQNADSFELAGYDDWRLPTIKELYSLMLFSGADPSGEDSSNLVPFIDDDNFAFEYGDTDAGDRIIDSQWATSSVYGSTVMGGESCFFGVNFADGRIKCYPTTNKGYFAIYVRGDSYGVNDLYYNGDGTITDDATGLMWTQSDSGHFDAGEEGDGAMSWEEALDWAEDFEYAGYDDWRLPNAKELHSIIDYDRSPDVTSSPAIDALFETTDITNEAGASDYPFFWTSTTHEKSNGMGDFGVYVGFGRCLGYMNGQWIDVHGAGCQRSDPKSGDPSDYPTGFGPQGDARRIYNYVRLVRDAS